MGMSKTESKPKQHDERDSLSLFTEAELDYMQFQEDAYQGPLDETWRDEDALKSYPVTIYPEATSVTHPLKIDWVPIRGVTGKLGITFAPGKHDTGRAVDWRRDLAVDLEVLRSEGVTRLVCLLEAHEFDRLKIPTYPVEAAKLFDWVHVPVVDTSIPETEMMRGCSPKKKM